MKISSSRLFKLNRPNSEYDFSLNVKIGLVNNKNKKLLLETKIRAQFPSV